MGLSFPPCSFRNRLVIKLPGWAVRHALQSQCKMLLRLHNMRGKKRTHQKNCEVSNFSLAWTGTKATKETANQNAALLRQWLILKEWRQSWASSNMDKPFLNDNFPITIPNRECCNEHFYFINPCCSLSAPDFIFFQPLFFFIK